MYTDDIPVPMAIPTGVVSEKKSPIVTIALNSNLACNEKELQKRNISNEEEEEEEEEEAAIHAAK